MALDSSFTTDNIARIFNMITAKYATTIKAINFSSMCVEQGKSFSLDSSVSNRRDSFVAILVAFIQNTTVEKIYFRSMMFLYGEHSSRLLWYFKEYH